MRMLVIGGNGMAGHMMVRYFRKAGAEVLYTVRKASGGTGELVLDATDLDAAAEAVERVRPDRSSTASACSIRMRSGARRRPIS